VKRNSTGSAMTIGLEKVIDRLTEEKIAIAQEIKTNLLALTEIRDNAIHYINAGPDLAKQVLEIGTATVTNFPSKHSSPWFISGSAPCTPPLSAENSLRNSKAASYFCKVNSVYGSEYRACSRVRVTPLPPFYALTDTPGPC
jgi:hypothetical protein